MRSSCPVRQRCCVCSPYSAVQGWRAHLCQEGSQAARQPGLCLQILVRHGATAPTAQAGPTAEAPHTARACTARSLQIPRRHTDHASAQHRNSGSLRPESKTIMQTAFRY